MKRPYEFAGPYAGCYRNRVMCMDERHVFTIFDILCAWPFLNALELGSFDGASTTAFVEACNRGELPKFTACDVQYSDSLKRVIESAHASRVSYTPMVSWELLAREGEYFDYDCILVDANHDLESVSRELDQILRRQPLCVIAHDTNASRMGYPKAEGAQHLADTLRKHHAYRGKCIEDAVRREGEETHRGLFFATTNQALWDRAREIFAARCPVMEEVFA